MASGQAVDEKASRVRSLLSSYYGTDEGADGGGAAGGSRGASIDSAAFDAATYVDSIVKGMRLDALQTRYVEMVQEIKSLDGDMQMLVYENYSKFITATDTIRRMKANVEGMGERMTELEQTIEGTTEQSERVSGQLMQHREQIEDLNGVRSLLLKLQAVFDLPAKMQVCLEHDSLDVLAGYYARAAPLLERYSTGAFEDVKAKVDAAVAEAANRVRARLQEPGTSPEYASECIELLGKLRQPLGQLQTEFLTARKASLTRILTEAAAGAAGTDGEGPTDPRLFIVSLNQEFLAEYARGVASFGDLFPDGRKALLDASRELFQEYFRVVRTVVTPPPGSAPPADTLMIALGTLSADLGAIHRLTPELTLNDRGAEVVERAVRHHVSGLFGAVERELSTAIDEAREGVVSGRGEEPTLEGQSLLKHFQEMCERLLAAIDVAIGELRVLLNERPVLLASWRDVFLDLVQGSFQHMFSAMSARFAEEGPKLGGSETGAGPLLLVLARLCVFLETNGVAHVMESLAADFAGGGAGDCPAFNAGEVIRALRTQASQLVGWYVEGQGRRLSLMVRRSVASTNWLQHPAPKATRPMCDSLLDDLAGMEGEVSQLLDDGGRATHRRNASNLGSSGDGGGRRAIERGVAKMFQQKMKIFDKVELTQASVMTGILKIALKSLVECVRLQTLGNGGFQQLQLDVHYLRQPLELYAEDPKVVETLLDELLVAAAERSVDPSALDDDALDAVLEKARKQGES